MSEKDETKSVISWMWTYADDEPPTPNPIRVYDELWHVGTADFKAEDLGEAIEFEIEEDGTIEIK